MTKRLFVGMLFRILVPSTAAMPIMVSLIAAALLNHFYSWEGKASLVVLAGLVGTVALTVSMFWILDECDSEIKKWLESLEKEEPKQPTPTPGSWT